MDDDAADAAQRTILDALAALRHDRPELLLAFAKMVMRRIDANDLARADPTAVATQIAASFTTVDTRSDDEVSLRVLRPQTALDGTSPAPTVIEVSCQDRPFLLSTVTDELQRRGNGVQRAIHPIIGIERDDNGRISSVVPARDAKHRESLLYLELTEAIDPDEDDPLIEMLCGLIEDIARVATDTQAMRSRLEELSAELRFGAWPHVERAEALEVADLLDWLGASNLIVLGIRDYRIFGPPGQEMAQVEHGSGLGLLHDDEASQFFNPVPIASLPTHVHRELSDAPLLLVTRTNRLSTVQRRTPMEYFALTHRGEDGRPDREIRILGLFTRLAMTHPARTTPVLRHKLTTILEREDLVPGSHDEDLFITMFQALPKDELFRAELDSLQDMLVDLIQVEEQGDVHTLVRPDARTSSVSVVVSVPRERYDAKLRHRIQAHLTEQFQTRNIDVELSLADRRSALVRFLIHTDGHPPKVPITQLRAAIRALSRSWMDDLQLILRRHHNTSGELADHLALAEHLPNAYQDAMSVDAALFDLQLLTDLIHSEKSLTVMFLPNEGPGIPRLRAAKRGAILELSAFIPILESLGLTVVEEVPYRLHGEDMLSLHDFGVRSKDLAPDSDTRLLEDAILAAYNGYLIVDTLNQLALSAQLSWREIAVLRAYRRLRRQLGTTFTSEYVNDTIVGHPDIARAIIDHFCARFAPHDGNATPSATSNDTTRQVDQDHTRTRLTALCDGLDRLDHDRILRGFLELIDATVRTNVFRDDAIADSGEPYYSFKLDTSTIADAPEPRPHREIFVHSPSVEGVHLRGGPVARGGLRWSDRRDDVRTEVLDLVKTQILKNGLIVPTGAKGGFVISHEPDDPATLREEVARQYVTFVRGLLDLTDDLDGDTLIPPPQVVRHDGDDPYLVVAADRGTATFSDTANALSQRYGFWLDDAFASGGSNGYDHKALGVTAKGAWRAVARHFRELGVDVQRDPVTVVGVGDMSGDVFGNGLLRSTSVRLVAAFDHRDIFLDPNPDPKASFAERQRLFDMPRSSWQDYDPARLSPGGSISPRAARSIALSDEIRATLGIAAKQLTPPELIRAILCAPVDLLFAGGIGNYVKASTERNEDIGDRVNAELRVDARDLRARVIGEGANLFISQRGRIEYAHQGGRINQDAIDNAAGVSTSDHEVNLKILLSQAQAAGRINQHERNVLLAELADEVTGCVMDGVDRQAAAISRELPLSPTKLDAYDRMMDRLTASHGLDREREVLPSTAALEQHDATSTGLDRPTLATLLAWAKRELKEVLLGSDILDLQLLGSASAEQFPPTAVERFGDLLPRHRLRRELIATSLANDAVDHMGITFVAETADTTGTRVADVVVAYRIAQATLDAPRWWARLHAMETIHDPTRLLGCQRELAQLITTVTATIAVHHDLQPDPTGLAHRLAAIAAELRPTISELGTAVQRETRTAHTQRLTHNGVESDLSEMLASSHDLSLIVDVDRVVTALNDDTSATTIMDTCLRLGDALGVDQLEARLSRTQPHEAWGRRQRDGIAADLRGVRWEAALLTLREATDTDHLTAANSFLIRHEAAIARSRLIVDQLPAGDHIPLDAIAVAARSIRRAIAYAPGTD